MQSYLSLALAWVSVVGSATAGVPISAREVYNVAIIGMFCRAMLLIRVVGLDEHRIFMTRMIS
jgi:hypothetical protein